METLQTEFTERVFLPEYAPAAPETLTDAEIDARFTELTEYLDARVTPEHKEALAETLPPKDPFGNDNPNSGFVKA